MSNESCAECDGYQTVIVDGEEVHCTTCSLRAEIERLRTAGDALAEVVDDWPELVIAWKEARRER